MQTLCIFMGIFDFLKKIFEDEKVEETKKEKITFSETKNCIENKRKETETKEKDIFILIKNRINILSTEIKEKIDILKKIDVNSKKGSDKIKFTVEEGRKRYVELLEYLIIDLNNLQENKLEKIIFSIDKIFSDFNKNSYLSYEKATILIGKEMEDIKIKLKVFSKELLELFDENKNIISSSQTISSIELKFRKSEKIKEEIEEINQLIVHMDQKIIFEEEQNKKILEEIERIKKNPEHLEYLKRLDKVKSLETDLEKDIRTLEKFIDFKALGSFYHIFENKMKILNLYKGDFQKNFQKDDGKEIFDLLNAAKLVTENISEIMKKINNKKEEIVKEKIQNEKEEHMIRELYSESSNKILQMNSLKSEKSQEEKRITKLDANEKEIIGEIKKEFEKLGIYMD
jgi:hypothetical protein